MGGFALNRIAFARSPTCSQPSMLRLAVPRGMAASSPPMAGGTTITNAWTAWPTAEIPNMLSMVAMLSFAAIP